MTNSTLMGLEVMILPHHLSGRKLLNIWTVEAAQHDPQVMTREGEEKRRIIKEEK